MLALALLFDLLLLKVLGMLTFLFISWITFLFFGVHILHRFTDITMTLQDLFYNLVVFVQINLRPIDDLTSQELHLLEGRSLLDLFKVELDIKYLLSQRSSSSELGILLLLIYLLWLHSEHIRFYKINNYNF